MSATGAPIARTVARVFATTFCLASAVLAFSFVFGDWGPDGAMPGWHYAVGVAMEVVSAAISVPFVLKPIVREVAEPQGHDDPGALLTLPRRAARRVGAWWLGTGAVFLATSVAFGHALVDTLPSVLLAVALALTASAVTYLSLERELRPQLAAVIRRGGAGPAVSIRVRLLVLWALAGGVPLLAVAVVVSADVPPAGTLLIVAASLVAGPSLVRLAGDVVTARLTALRCAVERVENGDLSARVEVDDTGEIGVLQTGLNRMVQGLEERDRAVELFGRHVSRQVAHHALASDPGQGQAIVASMLFVDLIESTPMTVRLSPDQVVAVLNGVFDTVVAVVTENGGVVSRFMGDGALCLFGAPEPDTCHADRALATARRLARDVLVTTGHHVAVGVAAGPVVAGNVGAELRYEYTVIGSAVNEAARLVELAKRRPSRALSSASIVALAGEEAAKWREAGWFDLRGFDARTLVFEPVAVPRAVSVASGS